MYWYIISFKDFFNNFSLCKINLFDTRCKTVNVHMFNYEAILSPLDQFEIRNLFSIDTPLLANINLSITNIGLYMTIAAFLAFYFSILATNHSRITPNK